MFTSPSTPASSSSLLDTRVRRGTQKMWNSWPVWLSRWRRLIWSGGRVSRFLPLTLATQAGESIAAFPIIPVCGSGRACTCYGLGVARTLAPRDEDDIPMACVSVIILQEEKLVDSVFLEFRDLYYEANWSGEAAFNDEVLLSPDLADVSVSLAIGALPNSSRESLTYSLE